MTSQRVMFSFPPEAADKPIISCLIRDYNLEVNIFRARVTQDEEGFMILDLQGEAQNIQQGLEYLKSIGISINENQTGLV